MSSRTEYVLDSTALIALVSWNPAIRESQNYWRSPQSAL